MDISCRVLSLIFTAQVCIYSYLQMGDIKIFLFFDILRRKKADLFKKLIKVYSLFTFFPVYFYIFLDILKYLW